MFVVLQVNGTRYSKGFHDINKINVYLSWFCLEKTFCKSKVMTIFVSQNQRKCLIHRK